MAPLLTLLPPPVAVTQAVAVPGTAERLTVGAVYALAVVLYAGRDDAVNTGNVFVGSATLDSATIKQVALVPGDSLQISAPPGGMINLYDIFVDAIDATDGVRGFYYPRP